MKGSPGITGYRIPGARILGFYWHLHFDSSQPIQKKKNLDIDYADWSNDKMLVSYLSNTVPHVSSHHGPFIQKKKKKGKVNRCQKKKKEWNSRDT